MRWPKINDTWRNKTLNIVMRVEQVDWASHMVHGTDPRTGTSAAIAVAEFAHTPCDWALSYKKPAIRASRQRTTADWA